MEGETYAKVNYEEKDILPDKDFELFYSVGQAEGIHLFSYLDRNDSVEDGNGYFTLLIAPPAMENVEPVAKDILFVLDQSGSMEGEKFQQAQSALIYVLKHLNMEDRFYLTAFNDSIQSFSRGLEPVSAVEDAIRWVEKRSPSGSTDINRALLEAVSVISSERPTYLIFLTDGLPTEGETDTQKIINNFYKSAPESLRACVFGVGYDVDTYLLDTLSEEHHGISTYVKPSASLEEIISGFYNKISSPVLTDLEIAYSNALVYDIYPRVIPDLFAGSQIVVVGRYRDGGETMISLSGEVNGRQKHIVFENQFFDDGKQENVESRNNIPRLWATRKIGYLLKEIRLKGTNQELVDQIVQLSIRYGIVTPYTSFLVTEPELLGVENQTRLSQEVYEKLEAAAAEPTYGIDAFRRAAEEGELADSGVAAALPQSLNAQMKIVGNRTFLLEEGVWIDTIFDDQNMKIDDVEYLSKKYFMMAEASPEIAAWMALGKYVIFVKGNTAYQVIDGNNVVLQKLAEPTSSALLSDIAEDQKPVDNPPEYTVNKQQNDRQSANNSPVQTEKIQQSHYYYRGDCGFDSDLIGAFD